MPENLMTMQPHNQAVVVSAIPPPYEGVGVGVEIMLSENEVDRALYEFLYYNINNSIYIFL